MKTVKSNLEKRLYRKRADPDHSDHEECRRMCQMFSAEVKRAKAAKWVQYMGLQGWQSFWEHHMQLEISKHIDQGLGGVKILVCEQLEVSWIVPHGVVAIEVSQPYHVQGGFRHVPGFWTPQPLLNADFCFVIFAVIIPISVGGQNDFVSNMVVCSIPCPILPQIFSKNLDYKLFRVLQNYSQGKPILVFVSMRKGIDLVCLRFYC